MQAVNRAETAGQESAGTPLHYHVWRYVPDSQHDDELRTIRKLLLPASFPSRSHAQRWLSARFEGRAENGSLTLVCKDPNCKVVRDAAKSGKTG